MPIYTKKGDKGKTGLISQKNKKKARVTKDSTQIEAIGAIDELNSYLGICLSFCNIPEHAPILKGIQENLFTVNSILAGSDLKFSKAHTVRLEKEIDKIDLKIKKLTTFVFPAGTVFATHLMYARAIARKVERRVVALSNTERVNTDILRYLNRLSDMLFTLFRDANHEYGVGEVYWKGKS